MFRRQGSVSYPMEYESDYIDNLGFFDLFGLIILAWVYKFFKKDKSFVVESEGKEVLNFVGRSLKFETKKGKFEINNF